SVARAAQEGTAERTTAALAAIAESLETLRGSATGSTDAIETRTLEAVQLLEDRLGALSRNLAEQTDAATASLTLAARVAQDGSEARTAAM
ncbi:hypothetical protein OQJ42_13460, partial [Enterococcus faecium]|uniref:hypothetical protein n=1 Tax=Enterococcus faecium TaxID=1352 RepID=UPI002243D03B